MRGTHIKGRLLAPLLLSALAAPVAAEAPDLRLPIACTLGESCYIQQYVDRDPGPGVQDHACGVLANDAHKGTDFGLPSLADMDAGVPVLAAAPGVVRGVRDGMPDIDATDPAAPDLTGRECGNGVAIDHGEGWETQYCHLRRGSVQVRQGQRVTAGEPLGLVGMSGMATFPHVHFSVRNGNSVIDPFRPDMTARCGNERVSDLWIETPPYQPGGLLAIGVMDRVPDYAEIKAGPPDIALSDRPAALVVWGYVFEGHAGDEVELAMAGPDGDLGNQVAILEKRQPFLFRAWGRRAPEAGFAAGRYTATVIHRRDGRALDRREMAFRID